MNIILCAWVEWRISTPLLAWSFPWVQSRSSVCCHLFPSAVKFKLTSQKCTLSYTPLFSSWIENLSNNKVSKRLMYWCEVERKLRYRGYFYSLNKSHAVFSKRTLLIRFTELKENCYPFGCISIFLLVTPHWTQRCQKWEFNINNDMICGSLVE